MLRARKKTNNDAIKIKTGTYIGKREEEKPDGGVVLMKHAEEEEEELILRASVAGVVHQVNKLITVIPPKVSHSNNEYARF